MIDLISVVIPTRNRCCRLAQAVASVRRQTGVNFEIIVVDDASSDDTPEVVRALSEEDSRLRYVRNDAPLGGGGTRNAGVAVARGEYVAFLDDDDQFLDGKLERQLAALRAHPSAPAASCSFVLYRGERSECVRLLHSPSDRQELLRANVLGGASVCMVRTEVFKKVGGFDPALRAGQDWDLWLKLHRQGTVLVCDEPLVRYNLHQDGQITGNFQAEYRGRRRIHLRYSGEMGDAVRNYSLCELFFFRRVLFAPSSVRRLKGLLRLMLMAKKMDRFRFAWRAFRYLRQGAF